jgi:hypothetical protein
MFKSQKMIKIDKDLLVISNKFINELRNLPEGQLSSIQALVEASRSPFEAIFFFFLKKKTQLLRGYLRIAMLIWYVMQNIVGDIQSRG